MLYALPCTTQRHRAFSVYYQRVFYCKADLSLLLRYLLTYLPFFSDSEHQAAQAVPVKLIYTRWETKELSPPDAPITTSYLQKAERGVETSVEPEASLSEQTEQGVWGGHGASSSQSRV